MQDNPAGQHLHHPFKTDGCLSEPVMAAKSFFFCFPTLTCHLLRRKHLRDVVIFICEKKHAELTAAIGSVRVTTELLRVCFDKNRESWFWWRSAVNLFDLRSSEVAFKRHFADQIFCHVRIVLLAVGVDLENWSTRLISWEFPVASNERSVMKEMLLQRGNRQAAWPVCLHVNITDNLSVILSAVCVWGCVGLFNMHEPWVNSAPTWLDCGPSISCIVPLCTRKRAAHNTCTVLLFYQTTLSTKAYMSTSGLDWHPHLSIFL